MSMFLGRGQPFFSERPEQTLIKKKFARAKAHILLEYTRLRLVRLALCSLLLRPRPAAVNIHEHRWISGSEQSSHVRRRIAQRQGSRRFENMRAVPPKMKNSAACRADAAAAGHAAAALDVRAHETRADRSARPAAAPPRRHQHAHEIASRSVQRRAAPLLFCFCLAALRAFPSRRNACFRNSAALFPGQGGGGDRAALHDLLREVETMKRAVAGR